VFLSHATVDKAFAIELATDLKEYGYRVWLDSWVIRAGDSIPERLEAGLRGARSVAVILSEAALRSKWVEREWQAK
jgi:hypothetical protein